MNEQFIPYEEALALKELGFNELCIAKYTVIPEDDIDWFTIPEQSITDKRKFGSSKNYNAKIFEQEGTISAPLFQQAFKWFREKHGMENWVYPNLNGLYSATASRRGKYQGVSQFNTYVEAELALLKNLIGLAKGDETFFDTTLNKW